LSLSKILSYLSRLAFVPVVVYCAALGRHALEGHFSTDDPMNMGYAWNHGFGYLLWHSITFWSTAYRPMGELLYLSIYSFFGMNPLPYRIAIVGVMVVNAYLSYRLAELLTGSRTVAFLTGVFAGAHAYMVVLYYQNSFVYDVLVYFFSILTLICYVSARKQGVPSLFQSAGIICLFIAALNSKEIGIALAGFILAYEVLFHGAPTWAGAMTWMKREGRLPMIIVLLGLIYAAGKLTGPETLAKMGGYEIHLSVAKYLESTLRHWNDLFYMFKMQSRTILVAIDVVLLTLLLFFKKSPAVRWCCFYILTALLPITFIPQRGGAQLYLGLFGWALLLAIAFVKLFETLSPALVWSRFKIPPVAISVVLVMVLTYFYVSLTVDTWRQSTAHNLEDQAETWSVLSQLRDLPFRPKPGSRVLFLDEPFKEFRMAFIAQLVWNDHSVYIDLATTHPEALAPANIAEFDSLLTVESGQVKLVRSSLEPVH